MAAPTTTVNTHAIVTAAGSSTALETNLASRQYLVVQNNGPQPVTIVMTSAAAAVPAVGVGLVINPGDLELLPPGPGIRLYGRVGPVPAGEPAVDQVSGACLEIVEMA
jgi:hypothetical protein